MLDGAFNMKCGEDEGSSAILCAFKVLNMSLTCPLVRGLLVGETKDCTLLTCSLRGEKSHDLYQCI